MKRKYHHANWTLRAAAVLLCLVLYTTHLMSGLFARYTTSSSASDNARVAKFDITESGTMTQSINFSINPLDTTSSTNKIQYAIVVANNSEVSMAYTIKAENLTDNLPLELIMQNNSTANNMTTGILNPSSKTISLMLNIGWNTGVADYNDFSYNNKVDEIIVTVECEQVD